MALPTEQQPIKVEQVGKVTVVRFAQPRLVEPELVDTVASQLSTLLERGAPRQVLVDFRGVERLTTDLMSRLITLHQRAQGLGGRLALCGIHPEIFPIFETLGLPKLLHIYDGEKAALRSF